MFLSLRHYTIQTIIFFLLVGVMACDTQKDAVEPTVVPTFRLESLVGKWKLTAGSAVAGGVIAIDDIFDAAKNPQAADVQCVRNTILDIRNLAQFSETSNCYGGTVEGKYLFDVQKDKTIFAITYNTPSIPPREYKLVELTAQLLKMSFEVNQSGFNVVITYTFERQ